MVDEAETLSGAAAARMHAFLPELLRAVRWRRRRRQAVRGAAIAIGVLGIAWFTWPRAASLPMPTPTPVQVVTSWTTVVDDPTVMARCECATVDRREWYVEDDGLQACLRSASRPAGMVRVAGKLLVDPAAIDALPEP